jgi:hypothetical protein
LAGYGAFVTSPTVVGSIGFGTVAAIQLDAGVTRFRNAWAGENAYQTLFSTGLQELGIPSHIADRAASGAEFVSNVPFIAAGVTSLTTRGLGVPFTSSANRLSPVREFDVYGNEIYYRAMAPRDFAIFQETGVMPASIKGETFISPSQTYASEYNGVLVRFTAAPGTMQELTEIGRLGNFGRGMAEQFPGMGPVQSGWMSTNVQFKLEGQGTVVNTGLGRGQGLRIFNENLIQFERLR